MRKLIVGALVAVQMAAGMVALRAEPYPHRTVTLVTHSSPGGGSDVFLRQLVKYLSRQIDATFVVENVQGGSGAKAMARLASSPPDGSVFYATTPTYIYTSLLSSSATTFRDLQPVVNFFTDSEVVYTAASSPYQTLADVIEHARTERGRWGAANPASLERQAAEQLKAAAGVQAAVVSHEGGGDMMINVLNGTLDIGIGEVPELRSQIESGQIRLLATFNPERLPAFPDVPTVKESGYDVVLQKFRGLAAPKGLSEDVAAIWDRAAKATLDDPEYRRAYEEESLISNFIGHDSYPQFVDGFADETAGFLRASGVIQ
ncbi:Bug family tripartite tricarboxylate transporter substrate binding protein [Aureimonas jatrophae]|uniref:Tripartite-type tricarboxylate transporter, receptor component TctC n=1 Tax=Aureimonas jatrophae TaxID=1166073 RepID=A0A1H0FPJ1_9HYPH|nr:tripartite tricarboxylate transporter substrate binding protein [Aureimonas jatrophae]MBB3949923.1 tripartite-type tricarboxylate transporter receptor subunit TctC [Aureimonas jatrophae]SDN96451.1 Tripartite-type tricarboxylate transporter, receptor component TctC [Aureimonas jatrophae]